MTDPGTDPLTAQARTLLRARPDAYTELVGPREAPRDSFDLLENVTPQQLFEKPVQSTAAAYGALAGLWLWHDGLHECHSIVQKEPDELLAMQAPASRLNVGLSSSPALDRDPGHLREMTSTFAFWHAIMHRREGDFGNSKYWYAHCRNHPLFAPIAANAREIVARAPADKALLRFSINEWNGAAFVDFVQSVHESPSSERYPVAVALQQLEWRMLFDYCVRIASS